MGTIFSAAGDSVNQQQQMCFAASGTAGEKGIEQKSTPMDFFHLKGDLEALLELFATQSLRFDAPASDYYHPGRSAKIVLNGNRVGELGQLHPDIASDRKFKQETWIAQLNVDVLFALPLREPRYERLSRFPSVQRDFSLLLNNSVSYEHLRFAIEALRIPELRSIQPHELFRGPGVPEGKYSLLLRLTFQSTERTLRDDEVAGWSQQVIAVVEGLGGSLRA